MVLLFLFAGALIPLAVAIVISVIGETAHTTGTVVDVANGTCTITFADRTSARHTLTDSGGRGGCSLHVGQAIGVWYQPASPTHADDQSPATRWVFGALFGSMAIGIAGYAIRLIVTGAWSRESP